MRFQIGRLTLVAFLRFHSSFVTILYPFPNLHPAVTVRVIVKEKMTALFYSGNLCGLLSLRCKRWIIILGEYEIQMYKVIEKIALFSSERVL